MTAQELYKTFLLKINKNDTNTNVNVSQGNFVIIYNEQAKAYVKEKLKYDSDNSDIDNLSELLVNDLPLVVAANTDLYTEFILPDDFFDASTGYSVASKGSCKGRILYNWKIKPKNRNTILNNYNTKPSFEYEETFVNLSQNKYIVFTDDFIIDEQYLSYYRLPRNIDVKGYTKIDGSKSADVDPDMSDVYVNEILNRCAIEVIRAYENPDGFQLAKDRLTKE